LRAKPDSTFARIAQNLVVQKPLAKQTRTHAIWCVQEIEYRSMTESHPLDRLYATIEARKTADAHASYTASLLQAGKMRCAKKFGEESVEALLAAVGGSRAELLAESADVLYHLLVLWAACGVTPAEVYETLAAREGRSGIEEKASRPQP
jgi:phosphoribosyl-ATP pyrophosphohydrolase